MGRRRRPNAIAIPIDVDGPARQTGLIVVVQAVLIRIVELLPLNGSKLNARNPIAEIHILQVHPRPERDGGWRPGLMPTVQDLLRRHVFPNVVQVRAASL